VTRIPSYFVSRPRRCSNGYERYVRPPPRPRRTAALEAGIGDGWTLTADHAPVIAGPTVVVAGRWTRRWGRSRLPTSSDRYPHASLAVDRTDAGHDPYPKRN